MLENLIVGALVVACLIYVVWRARRAFQSGGCGCDCGGGCGGGCGGDCGGGRRAEKKEGGCGGRRGCGCGEKSESTGCGRS